MYAADNRYTEVVPGVFYPKKPFVLCDAETVSFLKTAARRTPSLRARLCMHPSSNAAQHDMVIASHRDTYVAPHRHFGKSETLLVLEGSATALLYDESGTLIDTPTMGPLGSAHDFFYRMPEKIFHSLLIQSEFLIFVESTKGPFRQEDTEYASWAPAPNDVAGGHLYRMRMKALIDGKRSSS